MNRLLLVVLMVSSALVVQAQSSGIKVTYFGNNFAVRNDTIQLVLSGSRGHIQWQKSFDSKDWEDIEGKTSEALSYRIDTTLFFRAKVTEASCNAVYSDTTCFVPALLTGKAVVIDPQKVVLISDSSDLAKGVYRYHVNPDPGIKQGDVIVGRDGQGYIRVVDDAKSQGNEITLTTSQGTAEDVFRDIFISDSLVISLNEHDPGFARVNGVDVLVRLIKQAPGVTLESGGGIMLNNMVLINKKVDNTDVSAIINSGRIDFNPTVYLNLNISSGNGIESFSLSAGGSLAYSFGLRVICSDLFNYSQEPFPLLEVEIGPVFFGIVPMFINLSFNVGCELSFGDFGLFDLRYESDYSLFFGAGYDKNASQEKWSPIWKISKGFDEASTSIDIGGDLTAKLFIIPRISTRIAAVEGPRLEVEPFVKAEAQVNLPDWNYSLFGGINSRLGFASGIIGSDLADYNATFSDEWAIKTGYGTNPEVSTNEAQNITKSSADVSGTIISNSGSEITEKGVCWGLSPKPNIVDHVINLGSGSDTFSTNIEGLTENSKYYFRAYAINASGIGWGREKSFTASDKVALPQVETSSITTITATTATGGGNVTSNGGGTVSARGICWNTTGTPTNSNRITSNGTGSGSFTSYLTGLTASTIYFVRAYATNAAGTAYGEEIQFTTSGDTFTDNRDGQVYKKVTIGKQTWMAENLAWLPAVSPSSASSGNSVYYYVRGYEGTVVSEAKAVAYYGTYGVLYNLPAAMAACPDGWHLPSDPEWTTLTDFLGTAAGGKMKESGTAHWSIPNTGATNSSGFTALPGGYRLDPRGFEGLKYYASFWSSTKNGDFYGAVDLFFMNDRVDRYSDSPSYGFSVRCLED